MSRDLSPIAILLRFCVHGTHSAGRRDEGLDLALDVRRIDLADMRGDDSSVAIDEPRRRQRQDLAGDRASISAVV